MTQIISAFTDKNIFMASDTRLNYHIEENRSDGRYQKILWVADCIRKTFYLEKPKIGLQFLGIGYLPDDNDKYPLSHFIGEINKIDFIENININFELMFDFLKKISEKNNTGQYIKGLMCGFYKSEKYLCQFNTYNDTFDIKLCKNGVFCDSENNIKKLEDDEELIIEQIIDSINKGNEEKSHSIGQEIEILKLNKSDGSYLKEGESIFNGSLSDLIKVFKSDPSKIKVELLVPPKVVKMNL